VSLYWHLRDVEEKLDIKRRDELFKLDIKRLDELFKVVDVAPWPAWGGERHAAKLKSPVLEVGQRLRVKQGVSYFNHLPTKQGTYGGVTDSEVSGDKDCPTIQLDGGGIFRYINEEQLWKEWEILPEEKPAPPPKAPILEKKKCGVAAGGVTRRLLLQDYLVLEKDAARREQAERFAGLAEGDLYFEQDGNGVIRMCSPLVNDQVDQVDIQKCMEECNCEPVLAFPFCKLSDGTKVFSSPAVFVIGRGNARGLGYEYFAGSRQEMEDAGIPKVLQDRCEALVRAHHDPFSKKALAAMYQQHPRADEDRLYVSPRVFEAMVENEKKAAREAEKKRMQKLAADADDFLKDMKYGAK
jgi:hypothetical protein